MKILHVYKDFDPPVHGGIEGHVARSCRYQRAWGDVEALTCSRSWQTRRGDRDGTRVTEVAEWGRFQGAPLSPTFPWHLRQSRADVLVLHLPNPTAEIAWLVAGPPAKLVIRYHSDVVRQATAMRLYGPLQQRLLARADLILPTSQPYLDTSSALAAHVDRCRVLPLGIDPARFQVPDALRVKELHEAYGPQFVLFAGKHRYYKGLSVLVAAAASIKAPVVIAGDGPERETIMALAAAQRTKVHFPGHLSDSDLVAHLHASTVVAFPSIARSEAFGIAILEAHAAGRPVVATQLGTGVDYVNEHARTGLNVPPEDPVALAEALNHLLDSPEARAAMGEYGQARVARTFDGALLAAVEWNCYQELTG